MPRNPTGVAATRRRQRRAALPDTSQPLDPECFSSSAASYMYPSIGALPLHGGHRFVTVVGEIPRIKRGFIHHRCINCMGSIVISDDDNIINALTGNAGALDWPRTPEMAHLPHWDRRFALISRDPAWVRSSLIWRGEAGSWEPLR